MAPWVRAARGCSRPIPICLVRADIQGQSRQERLTVEDRAWSTPGQSGYSTLRQIGCDRVDAGGPLYFRCAHGDPALGQEARRRRRIRVAESDEIRRARYERN